VAKSIPETQDKVSSCLIIPQHEKGQGVAFSLTFQVFLVVKLAVLAFGDTFPIGDNRVASFHQLGVYKSKQNVFDSNRSQGQERRYYCR